MSVQLQYIFESYMSINNGYHIYTQVTVDGMTQTHTTEVPSYLYRPGAAVCDLQDFQYTTQTFGQNEEVKWWSKCTIYRFLKDPLFWGGRFFLIAAYVKKHFCVKK